MTEDRRTPTRTPNTQPNSFTCSPFSGRHGPGATIPRGSRGFAPGRSPGTFRTPCRKSLAGVGLGTCWQRNTRPSPEKPPSRRKQLPSQLGVGPGRPRKRRAAIRSRDPRPAAAGGPARKDSENTAPAGRQASLKIRSQARPYWTWNRRQTDCISRQLQQTANLVQVSPGRVRRRGGTRT